MASSRHTHEFLASPRFGLAALVVSPRGIVRQEHGHRRRHVEHRSHDDRRPARSARRPQGRPAGRRRGDLEHAHGLAHAAAGKFRRHHQLRPRVQRQLRHPGQLQRLPDLGHLRTRRSRRSTSAYFCPASQSDVSVYKNLLFVSAEAPTAALDCGAQGVQDTVSQDRIRGIRIFDITDIAQPEVHRATCRRAAARTRTRWSTIRRTRTTSTSTSRATSAVRSPSELPGCIDAPDQDPNSAHFRIEVIKVPLAHPEQAAIVSSPRIFDGPRRRPPTHGDGAAADSGREARAAARRARPGGFIASRSTAREQVAAGRRSCDRCSTAS